MHWVHCQCQRCARPRHAARGLLHRATLKQRRALGTRSYGYQDSARAARRASAHRTPPWRWTFAAARTARHWSAPRRSRERRRSLLVSSGARARLTPRRCRPPEAARARRSPGLEAPQVPLRPHFSPHTVHCSRRFATAPLLEAHSHLSERVCVLRPTFWGPATAVAERSAAASIPRDMAWAAAPAVQFGGVQLSHGATFAAAARRSRNSKRRFSLDSMDLLRDSLSLRGDRCLPAPPGTARAHARDPASAMQPAPTPPARVDLATRRDPGDKERSALGDAGAVVQQLQQCIDPHLDKQVPLPSLSAWTVASLTRRLYERPCVSDVPVGQVEAVRQLTQSARDDAAGVVGTHATVDGKQVSDTLSAIGLRGSGREGGVTSCPPRMAAGDVPGPALLHGAAAPVWRHTRASPRRRHLAARQSPDVRFLPRAARPLLAARCARAAAWC